MFLKALAIVFIQITAPNWNKIESNTIPQVNLSTLIQPLPASIDRYAEDTDEILEGGPPSLQPYKDSKSLSYLNVPNDQGNRIAEDILKEACVGLGKQKENS